MRKMLKGGITAVSVGGEIMKKAHGLSAKHFAFISSSHFVGANDLFLITGNLSLSV